MLSFLRLAHHICPQMHLRDSEVSILNHIRLHTLYLDTFLNSIDPRSRILSKVMEIGLATWDLLLVLPIDFKSSFAEDAASSVLLSFSAV